MYICLVNNGLVFRPSFDSRSPLVLLRVGQIELSIVSITYYNSLLMLLVCNSRRFMIVRNIHLENYELFIH